MLVPAFAFASNSVAFFGAGWVQFAARRSALRTCGDDCFCAGRAGIVSVLCLNFFETVKSNESKLRVEGVSCELNGELRVAQCLVTRDLTRDTSPHTKPGALRLWPRSLPSVR
jgi:hypothetical protein